MNILADIRTLPSTYANTTRRCGSTPTSSASPSTSTVTPPPGGGSSSARQAQLLRSRSSQIPKPLEPIRVSGLEPAMRTVTPDPH